MLVGYGDAPGGSQQIRRHRAGQCQQVDVATGQPPCELVRRERWPEHCHAGLGTGGDNSGHAARQRVPLTLGTG